MPGVVLPKTLAADHAKRASPKDLGGGQRQAWFSQRSWPWTMLSVVPTQTLAVDHAKRVSPAVDHVTRGSPRDSGSGLC